MVISNAADNADITQSQARDPGGVQGVRTYSARKQTRLLSNRDQTFGLGL